MRKAAASAERSSYAGGAKSSSDTANWSVTGNNGNGCSFSSQRKTGDGHVKVVK